MPATHEDAETQTLKVNVTEDQRMRLHTLKILTGRNISSCVRDALSLYFEHMADDPEGEQLLAQTDEMLS